MVKLEKSSNYFLYLLFSSRQDRNLGDNNKKKELPYIFNKNVKNFSVNNYIIRNLPAKSHNPTRHTVHNISIYGGEAI